MPTRRDFLQTSTLLALTPTVPTFLVQSARAIAPARDARILVVVQLSGGNDGINTIVPYKDEGYAKHRRLLRLPVEQLHKVTKELGFHPAMGRAAKLLEDGRLTIVQGVGYPNPERSHFKSMAIWHTANVKLSRQDALDVQTHDSLGWIGKTLDDDPKPANGSPAAQFIGSGSVPVALRGKRSLVSAMDRPENFELELNKFLETRRIEKSVGGVAGREEDLETFVRRCTLDAYAASDRMKDLMGAEDRGIRYPATALANRLKTVARLIKVCGGTRIYYTSQSNYDTHYVQLPSQSDLLAELSSALEAFLDDLASARLQERVVVLCFSEFGRCVEENGQGTDHGTAGPVFLAGSGVRPGFVGETPKLLDLEDGDLKMSIDFRRVYATVLEDWLGLPSKTALAGTFERLPLFRT